MIVTTKAIVLSSIKYAEADLIVSCYTEISGLKSYWLHNILTSRKGKLKKSLFLPLTQLELVALHREKGTLERIKEAKIFYPYNTLHTQIVKSTLAIFLAEILKNSIREDAKDIELFQYLENSLKWLDHHDSIANFHILFILNLSKYLGFYPDVSTIEGKYFNLLEGNFQDTITNNYCEEGTPVKTLKHFFGIDFDDLSGIKITKNIRFKTLNLLLMYYQLHLQNFQKPKSLLVLNQIFK